MRSFHPGLPTIAEAKENYNLVLSDHVPVLATIPVNLSKDISHHIKIVSWNVLESDAANGYAALGQSSYGETKEQAQDRYDRIANSLAIMIKENTPQFICLQEIANADNDPTNQLLFSKIKLRLPSYDAIKCNDSTVDANGCITLYNTEQFEPTPETNKKRFRNFRCDALGGSVTEYINKSNKQKIKIINAHAPFQAIPTSHEESIQKNLTQEEDNILSIVIGDFNCTVAPLDSQPRNITTSATVSTFRQNQLQGACAIDGCFYAENNNINNATIKHLNWKTGLPYESHHLNPIIVDNLSDLQKNEITRFEMAIHVDSLSTTRKFINGQYTTDEYQHYVRNELADPSLIVRAAKNLNNEDGLGITLTRACYQYLLKNNDDKFSCRIDENGITPRYIVLTSKANTSNLMQQIDNYCNIQNKNKTETYRQLHKELLEITTHYAEHLKQNFSIFPDEIPLYNKKVSLIQEIQRELEYANKGFIFDKIQSIQKMRSLIVSKNDIISEYRGPDWRRYLRNISAAFACTAILPIGGIAALVSKWKYNTFQFWQTTGYKEKELLLSRIESAENKLKNR